MYQAVPKQSSLVPRIDELRNMFMAMDRNGDGTLTVAEVKDALGQAKPTDSDTMDGFRRFLDVFVDCRLYMIDYIYNMNI